MQNNKTFTIRKLYSMQKYIILHNSVYKVVILHHSQWQNWRRNKTSVLVNGVGYMLAYHKLFTSW